MGKVRSVSGQGILALTGLLGVFGCGGQRVDLPSNEGRNTPRDAGVTRDPASSAMASSASKPSETNDGESRSLDDAGAPANDGDAGDSSTNAVTPTDDTSTDDDAAGRLQVETVTFVEQSCARGNWCWVTPAPFGERFDAIDGSPDGNTVFAVGADAACVQYDVTSGTWTEHRSVGRGDLLDVKVVSASEVWVAGGNGLDFYDGTSWRRQMLGYTTSVVQTWDAKLWVVNGDALYTRENGAWQKVVPTIDGEPVVGEQGGVVDVVTGEQDGELWALTFQYRTRAYRELEVVHLKDGTWSKLPGGFDESYGVDFAAYGDGIYFADYTRWYDVKNGWVGVDALPEQWVSVGDSTFQVTGNRLARAASDEAALEVPNVRAMWASSAEDVWLALAAGGLMRVDRTTQVTTDPFAGRANLPWHTTTGIEWTASPTDAWRGPELEHFDGATWTKVTTEALYIEAISGTGPSDVWFLDTIEGRLWHWDGVDLEAVAAPNPDARVSAIHAFDAHTLWVADSLNDTKSIHRFDGNEWSFVKSWTFEAPSYAKSITGFAGEGASDAYVVLRDHVEHFDGETWQTVFTAPDGEVLVAAAVEGERVWILGGDYVYLREPNGEWTRQWFAFQGMSWIGVADGVVWIRGHGGGVLRLEP